MKNKIILLNSILFSTPIFSQEITYSTLELKQNIELTEKLLIDMLSIERLDIVEELLPIYENFNKKDLRLINYAKFSIIKELLLNYKNSDAKRAIQEIKNGKNLTMKEEVILEQYLKLIKDRNKWGFSFSANYIRNKNINNATKDREIENTGFLKSDEMMPKSGKGVSYFLSAERNWNISESHYLHFNNTLFGKYYLNNSYYNEITNRIYLGYVYQKHKFKLGIKPFYEYQWFSNDSYNWSKGVRLEYQKIFGDYWQSVNYIDINQSRYFEQVEKNGITNTLSSTLIYNLPNQGYIYIGGDFIRETTKVKQYSNDTKSLRLGWKKNWKFNIFSQVNGSISFRKFKDFASLGNILPLDKIRKDKVYTLNLTVWKSDFNLLGFTPKINITYKDQKSNLNSLYSYTDKNIKILIEKDF